MNHQSEISRGSFLWRSNRESSPPAGISKRNSCLVLLEGSNKASLRHFQQPRIALPPIRGFRPRDCALDGFAGIGKLPDQFVFAHLTRTDYWLRGIWAKAIYRPTRRANGGTSKR